ncbi:MAG: hypothetical protein ACFFF4_00920 [Candidatus Thorarchaeota archaeon]
MDSPERSGIKQGLIELDHKIGSRLDELDVQIRRRITPFIAIMLADLKGLLKTRITYGWLIAAAFIHFLSVQGGVAILDTSTIIIRELSTFTTIWTFLIIGISASAVSSESGELADSIMSKAVKRYDYILAKFTSRITYMMTIFLVITLIIVGFSIRGAENTHDITGLVVSILFVALLLIMITTLGVTLSTMTSNTIISVISLLIIWAAMITIFPVLDLGLIAPTELMIALLDVIQGVWIGDEWIPAVVYGTITILSVILSTVYFSIKDL